MRRMSLSRALAVAALLAAGGVIVSAPACIVATDRENAADCLKADDCASKLCVQGICISRNGEACKSDEGCASGKCIASKCAPYAYSPGDGGGGDTGLTDTGPTDTGPVDTGPADTGKADTGKGDADARD